MTALEELVFLMNLLQDEIIRIAAPTESWVSFLGGVSCKHKDVDIMSLRKEDAWGPSGKSNHWTLGFLAGKKNRWRRCH